MLNIFVDDKVTFTISVYAYEQDGEIQATAAESEIPADVENVETLKFTFKKANYKDSNTITGASIATNVEGDLRIDIAKLQDQALRKMLLKWDLKDQEGKDVPLDETSINKLSPEIARVVTAEALVKIKI